MAMEVAEIFRFRFFYPVCIIENFKFGISFVKVDKINDNKSNNFVIRCIVFCPMNFLDFLGVLKKLRIKNSTDSSLKNRIPLHSKIQRKSTTIVIQKNFIFLTRFRIEPI